MSEKLCQSCAMPLTEELSGTEQNGAKSEEYCLYCYEQGAFKQPELTMEQMIEICIPFMQQSGMEAKQARHLLQEFLPKLKRWQ
ncbi:zinc ribbon domain-containing protein [Brevibacillus massiliensis]|uniref:zinc ribbon domain-containing protein n=1 Tax=Brevibacillus massiliensis TaxID=1118054 RepID=UPI00031D58EA|nr:zinc ribbon domain-containing protein [Brevibacillus massiliensis]